MRQSGCAIYLRQRRNCWSTSTACATSGEDLQEELLVRILTNRPQRVERLVRILPSVRRRWARLSEGQGQMRNIELEVELHGGPLDGWTVPVDPADPDPWTAIISDHGQFPGGRSVYAPDPARGGQWWWVEDIPWTAM